jgi:hypothetical protein
MKLPRLFCSVALLCSALLPLPASAVVTEFGFLSGMTGANEVPANASTGSVIINSLTFDSSVGSFGVLTVNLSFTGLISNASAAHVHGVAGVGVNAGVMPGSALTVTTATSGSVTGTWTAASAGAVDSLFAGNTYINLHSGSFPGGELRGQLVAIPEPATAALLLGAAGAGFLLWRRRLATRANR